MIRCVKKWLSILVFAVCVAHAYAQETTFLPIERRMLFNAYGVSFPHGDYYNANWTHIGPALGGPRMALLAGTNHIHTSDWKLTACRAGTPAYMTGSQYVSPISYTIPLVPTNYQACLQNSLNAMIESPFYTNGIGTIYFDAINVDPSRPTQITVQISTNMVDSHNSFYITNIILQSENFQFQYNWQDLDILQLEAVTNTEITRYARLLNVRTPVRFRIMRTGTTHTGLTPLLDNAYTAVDNICASIPPSDVKIRLPEVVFQPGYPYVLTNAIIRCYVDNVDQGVPTTHLTRNVTVYYRWRYLDQITNAWSSVAMSNIDVGDGAGNDELYSAVLPLQQNEGDLEYYFVCNFEGYRYKHIDYTQSGTNFVSEHLSPRVLRGGASQPDGREFYVRLRPYQSSFSTVQVLADQYAEPIDMALVGDNEWRGMIPINNGAVTNLNWLFRGISEHVAGSNEFSTTATYWSEQAQAGAGRVPYGGVCTVTSNTAPRIRVTVDTGGYVQILFNTKTLAYMSSRAEYQNFNAWPAPPETFTESSGQASKQRFLNTFDAWPSNNSTVISEYFVVQPAAYAANTNYSVEPFPTANGWLAASAAYVRDRTAADVNNSDGTLNYQNVALRLKGGQAALGLGYVHNRVNTRPDGLQQMSFRSRLGQPINRHEIAWHRYSFTNSNYLIRATVKADAQMSPEAPSVSLVGYYRDPGNFYEYRITQITNAANLAANNRVNHQLFKWTDGVPNLLRENKRNADAALTTSTQIELRLFNSGASTVIKCKFGTADNVIAITNSTAAIQMGSFGLLNSDCRAGFSDIQIQPTTTYADASGTATSVLISTDLATYNAQIGNWYMPAGRFEGRVDDVPRGIYSIIPAQKLGVYLQPSSNTSSSEPAAPGTTAWTKVGEVTFSNFTYVASSVTFNNWQSQFVMLRVLGRTDDLTVDVAVDELQVSSWRGQTSSDSGNAANGDWVAREAWVVAAPVAGLNEGQVSGSFNKTAPNPKTSLQLSARYAASTAEGLATNSTAIYSGHIYLSGSGTTNQFREKFAGSVLLKVDGVTVLDNTNATDVSTGQLVRSSGWYSFELRLGRALAAAGPWDGGVSGHGVAYSKNGGATWLPLSDTGDGLFLRTYVNHVRLDHSRADPSVDQELRSKLLVNGMGSLEFDYKVLRPPAKISVQYAPEWDSSAWTELQAIVVTNTMSGFAHISVYAGRMGEAGYLRILNERSGIYTNALIEIDNAIAWDEPLVEDTSWRVYNAKITSTDKQRVYLDESAACFLNNSQTADADPVQNLYEPFLQSPRLPAGLGTLSFMARAYSNGQPATVSVFVSTNGWGAPASQWFMIHQVTASSNLYQRYFFKPVDGRTYDAVRLVTGTGGGAYRAGIEEVAISEPVFPGFDILNVRPVCKGSDGEYEDRYQPLDSDEVGIEARIANIQLSPSNIQMFVSYYVGTNVWGVGNWPVGETITKPMYPLVGDSTLYRTLPVNDIPFLEKDQVVQYQVWATYEGDGASLATQQQMFDNPSWYYPIDLNQQYTAQGWSPYYIVYGVPLGAVWINEINAVDNATNGVRHYGENQYIEIAVPAGVDLAGWKIELVNNLGNATMITIPEGLPAQDPVTNGYAFFVIGEHPYTRNTSVPALPKLDYGYSQLSWFMPTIVPGGIRLRRPLGMYEHTVAYDWDPTIPGFDGETWASTDPEGRFVYVGREHQGGSLSVTNDTGASKSNWVFPLTWTPGLPNLGQDVRDAALLAPGVSNVVVTSYMATDFGTQNGRTANPLLIKVKKGGTTNIVYQANDWYRLASIKVNETEVFAPGEEQKSFNLVFNAIETNTTVVVDTRLRSDINDLGISGDVLTWLMKFDDSRPLVSSFYLSSGDVFVRDLMLTELYWLDADPTVTNYLRGSFVGLPEKDPVTTNYHLTVSLSLSNQVYAARVNLTNLQGNATFKVGAKQSLLDTNWKMISQYKFTPDSFDANHQSRFLILNPFIFHLLGWNPDSLYFTWTIEMEDPRLFIYNLTNVP